MSVIDAAVLERHGLKPEHRVLDIGCGVGRVALPLTRYLTSGTYDGFDIVKRWIRCVLAASLRATFRAFSKRTVKNTTTAMMATMATAEAVTTRAFRLTNLPSR